MTEQPNTPMTDDTTPSEPTPDTAADDNATAPSFGWTTYAEQINGRFAMLGFIALLILELVTRQDFFSWLGLR
jgi:hypothetical protein